MQAGLVMDAVCTVRPEEEVSLFRWTWRLTEVSAVSVLMFTWEGACPDAEDNSSLEETVFSDASVKTVHLCLRKCEAYQLFANLTK